MGDIPSVWPTLLCRVFIHNSLFTLPQSSLPVLCQHTGFLLGFLFGCFFTPKTFTYIWGWIFGYQEGWGTYREAADGFPIAGHSLQERTVASLNHHGSLGVLAAVPLQFLPWNGPLLRYLEIILPLSVVGEKLSTFFFKMSGEAQGPVCSPRGATQVQESRWWSRVMHRQTAPCEMQQVSVSNLCGCFLLKLTFGISQRSKEGGKKDSVLEFWW